MKRSWTPKALGDICVVDWGNTDLTKSAYIEGGQYLAVSAAGCDGRIGHKEHAKHTPVLSAIGAQCGKMFLPEEDFTAIKNTITFTPLNGVCTGKFLYQLLTHVELPKRGAAQPFISKGDIQQFQVLIPSLSEQEQIVALLDEAFESIAKAKANTEKNLQNARALFESRLQSIFTQRGQGWKEKRLQEISISFGRGKSKHRPRNAPHLYGGKYPFIQTGDIRNAEHIITEYTQTYSEEGLAQSKLWPKGTICITIAANIAETAILGFDACFPDSVIGVVADPKEAHLGFIEYLLQSFKTRIQAKGKGSAQANINIGTFEQERFPFPSVAEQKRISAELDLLRGQTQHLTSLYEQKLAALESLKKSLLHQAFSGELTRTKPKSKIVPFPAPAASKPITTTDMHAGILALAFRLHERHGNQTDFNHVKAEKIAHLVEAIVGIDLGRNPIKDAAGPNDTPHLRKVEHRAELAGFFIFKRSKTRGPYQVTKLRRFGEIIDRAEKALAERQPEVERLLETMTEMTWREAEVFATTYAAWNNLLLDGKRISDETIVREARENWHPDKLKIPRDQFFSSIEWMRKRQLTPKGQGKKVLAKAVSSENRHA